MVGADGDRISEFCLYPCSRDRVYSGAEIGKRGSQFKNFSIFSRCDILRFRRVSGVSSLFAAMDNYMAVEIRHVPCRSTAGATRITGV